MNSEIYVEEIPIAGEKDIELSKSDISHIIRLASEQSEITIKKDTVRISSLSPIGKVMIQLQANRERINPDLLDNLGGYNDVVDISTIGLLSPGKNSPSSILSETETERSSLRTGGVRVDRESQNTALLKMQDVSRIIAF